MQNSVSPLEGSPPSYSTRLKDLPLDIIREFPLDPWSVARLASVCTTLRVLAHGVADNLVRCPIAEQKRAVMDLNHELCLAIDDDHCERYRQIMNVLVSIASSAVLKTNIVIQATKAYVKCIVTLLCINYVPHEWNMRDWYIMINNTIRLLMCGGKVSRRIERFLRHLIDEGREKIRSSPAYQSDGWFSSDSSSIEFSELEIFLKFAHVVLNEDHVILCAVTKPEMHEDWLDFYRTYDIHVGYRNWAGVYVAL